MIGYIDSCKSSRVQECTRELFWGVIRGERVKKLCEAIARAHEQWQAGEIGEEAFKAVKDSNKRKLPAFTFQAVFPRGQRKNESAVPTGFAMLDIDHLRGVREFYHDRVEPRLAELGIILAHLTPSGEGLRLVFLRLPGMDLVQAQAWMAYELGVKEEYDKAVKDLARISFAVPEEYILFIDEEKLFSNEEPLEMKNDLNEERTMKNDLNEELRMKNEESLLNEERIMKNEELAEDHSSFPKVLYSTSFKGQDFSDIIRRWFALTGGEPQEGERNVRLSRLACELRYVTDNNPRWLLQILPDYGLPRAEMESIVKSACSQPLYSNLPRTLRQVLLPSVVADAPPQMPRKLPRLVELLLSRTPEIYQPAVAHAIFPALGAHLCGVTFRYIDNTDHEATLMNVLMAPTGAGKNCVNPVLDAILADIRVRDDANLARERAWKNQVNSRGANQTRPKRPQGLVIQEVDPDMTNAAFVQRLAEAEGHFLYAKMNEINQFDALKGNGRGDTHFQIMCLAFDFGNRYGQTRVGTQSVSEKVTIRFNWNASTTVKKGKNYFRKVLTDGPISRINFCTIPEREIGFDIPVYGTYGPDFDEELRPYLERLTRARGRIDCPEAFQLAQRLSAECAEHARLTQSRVYENFTFRGNVIAYLKACVLFVANGSVWEPEMEDFIRWSLEYDVWCKMFFFGKDMAREMDDDTVPARRGPQNLLTFLPDDFSYQDLVSLRAEYGMSAKGTAQLLSQWKKRGHVQQLTDKQFRKLRYRNDGNDFDPNA